MNRSHTANLLEKIADEMGAEIIFEPDSYNAGGCITFANGKRLLFMNNQLGLNPSGATSVANDKHCAAFLLKNFGYSVADEILLRHDDPVKEHTIQVGEDFAISLGFPVIVKPRNLSKGKMVFKVNGPGQYREAVTRLFSIPRHALVQRYCPGSDYRIVVFEGEVVAAYHRSPPAIVGDGVRSIAELVCAYREQLHAKGRDVYLSMQDHRIQLSLQQGGFRSDSVLGEGEEFVLLANANLSSGGFTVDLSESIHPSYRDLCINVTKDMGLSICGVDLITSDITKTISDYVILEINATPGLRNFAALGASQDRRVHALYARVLRTLEGR